MIPPHNVYQIYHSLSVRDDCTPSKCGKLSEYTDSAHTEVEDPSLGCMNVSNVYDRCGHDAIQLHPSCTACRRTANLPGLTRHELLCENPNMEGEDTLDEGTGPSTPGHRLNPVHHLASFVGANAIIPYIDKWSHLLQYYAYFSFQPVLHDWCNKGCGMCYPVCGMVHIKEPLLLIDKSSLCGGSGFPFSLSEWSLTICLTQYNRR